MFSIYEIKSEDYYIQTDFNDSEYEELLNTIKSRSIKEFNVELSKDDKILTFSTCVNNNKYSVVLHSRKITE